MNTRRGFSLIEVLVALAILSFGMLGIAALQITGVRANQGAYLRSQATLIANDMAERMYANRIGTMATLYDTLNFTSGDACVAPAQICSAETGNAGANCTAAQMAAYDRYVVSCGLPDGAGNVLGGVDDLLPRGQIIVECPAPGTEAACAAGSLAAPTSATTRRIRVMWQEKERNAAGEAADQTQTVTLIVRP